ncbi:MAG: 2Fe-2S iron-sulfur cluster-binding protein [Methanobacteriota archaeon]
MPSGVMIEIVVDGKKIHCQPNQTVLEVAKANNISIPTMCLNPLFPGHKVGACRMCLVEITGGGRPGLQPSCTLPVSSGLAMSTCSDAVYNARRTVVELMLTEHVQKCRDCPISGDCNFARLCRDYDVNGVPVCAECPNQREGCLLKRGVLCVGPITYANCNAYCTRQGYRCEGCHSVMVHDDILKFGIRAFKDAGFKAKDIVEAAKVFSYDSVKRVEKALKEEGMK